MVPEGDLLKNPIHRIFVIINVITLGPIQRVGSSIIEIESISSEALMLKGKLNYLLNRLKTGSEKKFGFQNRKEFSEAIIGEPYQVYIFSEKFLQQGIYSTQNSVNKTVRIIYPVILKGDYIGLLYGITKNGNVEIESFNHPKIANELKKIETIVSSNNPINSKVLLFHPNIRFEFSSYNGELDNVGNGKFIPLLSARRVMKNTLTNRKYSEMNIWQIQRFIK